MKIEVTESELEDILDCIDFVSTAYCTDDYLSEVLKKLWRKIHETCS